MTYIGQSLKRRPGMRSSSWYPGSPLKAIGLSLTSFLNDSRLFTRPISVGPMLLNDLRTTMRMTNARNPTTGTIKPPISAA